MPAMDAFENAARDAAGKAGSIVREHWARRKPVDLKSSAIDLVTETDRACERAILEILNTRFPDHGILAEESGRREGGEYEWVVDPLDGTTNFAHGYPQVAVSIALRRAGETLLAVVHDAIREETFCARRGEGATCDGRPIRVTDTGELSAALLLTGFPYDRRRHVDFYLEHLRAFMMRCHGVRREGSAALDLCWIAAGRADGFWEWKLKPWDTAAGALIVEEAGGRVSDFSGDAFDPSGEQCLATNARIHEEMLQVLAEILPRRPW